MTLASVIADLAEQAIRDIAEVRACTVPTPHFERHVRAVHEALNNIHREACEVLDDEDPAPRTQEEVTRP